MASSPSSLRRFAVTAAAALVALAPSTAEAACNRSRSGKCDAGVTACLDAAGIAYALHGEADAWTNITARFNERIVPDPVAIAEPKTVEEVKLALACGVEAGLKVTTLGVSHSFQGWAWGQGGNLVISQQAFSCHTYDPDSQLVTFGGGAHVADVARDLWFKHGVHFPHARGAHPGLTASSFGGGFGTSSRLWGSAVDNLVSMDMLLYNGTVLTIDESDDLFWAARGAAASFGIVLSTTMKVHRPAFNRAINFTISLGNIDLDTASRAIVALQDSALKGQFPDEFGARWTLNAPPFSIVGYYYGDPDKFDSSIAPLMADLTHVTATTSLASTLLPFWEVEVAALGPGINQPNGGTLGNPTKFYVQSLTVQADAPLTVDTARALHEAAITKFNRTDLRSFGFLDLWGGAVARKTEDGEMAYAHHDNIWLIRLDGTSGANAWPEDGVSWLKSIWQPWEDTLVRSGVTPRGFPNYADTEWTLDQWSSKLYGANFERLKQIKKVYDPHAVFGSHKQGIPLP